MKRPGPRGPLRRRRWVEPNIDAIGDIVKFTITEQVHGARDLGRVRRRVADVDDMPLNTLPGDIFDTVLDRYTGLLRRWRSAPDRLP